jgi:hypothetical protein
MKFIPYRIALGVLLYHPGARLVLAASYQRGDQFRLEPDGRPVKPEIARSLIRDDLVVADPGLFPDRPQSWKHKCHTTEQEVRDA